MKLLSLVLFIGVVAIVLAAEIPKESKAELNKEDGPALAAPMDKEGSPAPAAPVAPPKQPTGAQASVSNQIRQLLVALSKIVARSQTRQQLQ